MVLVTLACPKTSCVGGSYNLTCGPRLKLAVERLLVHYGSEVTAMTDESRVEDLEFTDAELTTILENHGIDRRTVLGALGLGSVAVLGSGTASARPNRARGPAQGASIHPYLGYTDLPDDIDPTSFLKEADHVVDAMIHLPPREECGPFHFDPAGLHVQPGDIVCWAANSDFEVTEDGPTGHIAGDHTITAYSPVVSRQRRIPEAATPFSSPMMGIDVSWYYRFEVPGVYDIYCGPHEGLGMVMRVVVGDVTTLDFGPAFDPESPPGPSNPSLFDQIGPLGAASHVLANLDPEEIVEDGPVDWDESLCAPP